MPSLPAGMALIVTAGAAATASGTVTLRTKAERLLLATALVPLLACVPAPRTVTVRLATKLVLASTAGRVQVGVAEFALSSAPSTLQAYSGTPS